MIRLHVDEPGAVRRSVAFDLIEGESIVIGRGAEATIRLDDAKTSALHCRIERTAEGYFVVDLGSRNGVGLGEGWVTRSRLQAGDTLRIGRARISIDFDLMVGEPTEPDQPAVTSAHAPSVIIDLAALAMYSTSGPLVPFAPAPLARTSDKAARMPVAVARSPEAGHPPAVVCDPSVGDGTLTFEGLRIDDHLLPALELRPVLRLIAGPLEPRTFVLAEGHNRIGRAAENELVLDHPQISRRHARLIVAGTQAMVEGLGARSDIEVDRVPIDGPTALVPGSLIKIGPAMLEFGRAASANESATSPDAPRRFIVGAQVFAKSRLLIGRRPGCDVVIDEDDIDGEHLALAWATDGRVALSDLGYLGVWLNGRRVVEADVKDGDRIGFGQHGLRVALDGLTCRLELVSATLTGAFELVERLPTVETFITGPGLIGEHSGTLPFNRPAPAAPRRPLRYRPPGDVRRSRWGLVLVLAGLATSGVGVAALGADALVERPLSPGHGGREFTEAAGGQRCGGCHEGMVGMGGIPPVNALTCRGCHAEHEPRTAHATAGAIGADCLACHWEHEAPPAALGRVGCTNGTCHAGARHDIWAAAEPGMPSSRAGVPLKPPTTAPLLTEMGAERLLALRGPGGAPEVHRLHGGIEGRCMACHAMADGTPAEAPEANCLRCHGGIGMLAGSQVQAGLDRLAGRAVFADRALAASKTALASDDCRACHSEHGDRTVAAPSAPPPASPSGFDLGLVLLGPVMLLVGVRVWWRPPVIEPQAPPVAVDPKLQIHIEDSLCVGSEECVKACPYSVLELVTASDGRRFARVANFESCNECNTCVEVCEPKALTRRLPGTPIPMVSRPFVDAHFMTSLPGVYLIGQAAGVSFVRNAINLGARAVHHALHGGLQPGMAAGLDTDLAIVGAGPAGLSAAITAARTGLRAVVFERGDDFAQTIRGFHDGKPVQNQPAAVGLIGPLWVDDCVREDLLAHWTAQLAAEPIDIRCHTSVHDVRPLPADATGAPAGFSITTDRGTVTAARVILAIGGGEPRRLEIPGGHLPKVLTACRRPDAHDREQIVVVGGGNSALEVAIACVEAHGGSNTVRLVHRGDAFDKASKRRIHRITALEAEGRLIVHRCTQPIAITSESVHLRHDDGTESIVANTWIYTMLGKVAPTRWLQSLGIDFVDRPQSWSPARSDDLSFLELPRSS